MAKSEVKGGLLEESAVVFEVVPFRPDLGPLLHLSLAMLVSS